MENDLNWKRRKSSSRELYDFFTNFSHDLKFNFVGDGEKMLNDFFILSILLYLTRSCLSRNRRRLERGNLYRIHFVEKYFYRSSRTEKLCYKLLSRFMNYFIANVNEKLFTNSYSPTKPYGYLSCPHKLRQSFARPFHLHALKSHETLRSPHANNILTQGTRPRRCKEMSNIQIFMLKNKLV